MRQSLCRHARVAADGELAYLAFGQGPPRDEIDGTDRHSGERRALAVQAERQWVIGIGPYCPPQCVPCRNLGDVVSNQPGSQ
jgi:hypothetical protein